MNANAIARNYGSLTPEERFRLILAASGRGDETECERLMKAAQRITLSMYDHAPIAQAFFVLEVLMFIELVEDATVYSDAWRRLKDFEDAVEVGGTESPEGKGPDAAFDPESGPEVADKLTEDERFLRVALAAGYLLCTKANGWKLFCERLSVPPFDYVKGFPGFERLDRILALSQEAAFNAEGMTRWLNSIRPVGAPPRTEVPLTVEGVAAMTEVMFRRMVKMEGG